MYDQPNNATFFQKVESVQYKVALAIIGAIQGTSQENLLVELGLETFKSRRWLRRLCCMYKIINIGLPKYLTDLISKREIGYKGKNVNYTFFIAELKVLKIYFSHILLRLGIV